MWIKEGPTGAAWSKSTVRYVPVVRLTEDGMQRLTQDGFIRIIEGELVPDVIDWSVEDATRAVWIKE